jgi:hypothetical protein
MYERTSTIDRAGVKPVSKTGQVSGILATSGEASDGHILNVGGGKLKRGSPLLFNHDAIDGNLGSWVDFDATGDVIRGTAQIELDGIGEKAAWRNDVAFMVDQGHIPGFSIRWKETKTPTRRVDLAKDHPAYVDAEREQDFNKLYGLYFDRWQMLEGSIVTLPSDQGALIGRMRDAKTDARTHWTRVLERMAGKAEPDDLSRTILDSFNEIGLDELQSVELDDGRTFFVPRELAAKLSTRERKPLPEPEVIDVSLEIEEDAAALEPDEATPLVTASEDASVSELARDDLFDLIREEVAPVYQEIRKEWRELLYQIVGKV